MKRNVFTLLMSLFVYLTYAQSYDNVPIDIQKYILNGAKDELDSLRRVQILKMYAKMLTAYEKRDTAALMNLYGSKVVSAMNSSHLEMFEKMTKCSKMKFDVIKVRKHPAHQDYYIFEIHQKCEPASLNINGFLLQLLHFQQKNVDKEQLPNIFSMEWRQDDDFSQVPSGMDIDGPCIF